MADMTTTTGAVFIPELWSMETLRAQEGALVVAPLVKRYDSLVKGRGDTVHIPEVSNLVANDKIANTDVTLQSPTESEKSIAIDQWKEASFLVEDILKTQSNYDLNNIESFYSNVVEKNREFGERLEQSTPSGSFCSNAKSTCNDYVRFFLTGKRDSLN